MHLYRVVIGTYYLGIVAAHSEEEAINTAVHNVFLGYVVKDSLMSGK